MTAPACTCGARAPSINLDHATSTPTRDINCPIHGLEALISEVRYPDEEEGSSPDS